MAERSTGPVRPPTLEGTARKADAPSGAKAAAADRPDVETKPESGSASGNGIVAYLAAGLAGGAAVGALFLGLSLAGVSVSGPARVDEATLSELESLRGRIAILEQSTDSLARATDDLGAELATEISAADASLTSELAPLRADLTALQAALAKLEQAMSTAAGGADLSALAAELAGLAARVDQLAEMALSPNGTSVDPESLLSLSTLLSSDIAALRTDLEAQTERFGAIAASVSELGDAQTALASRLEGVEAQLDVSEQRLDLVTADQTRTVELGTRVNLPLAIAAMDEAVNRGGAFDAELFALNQIIPDLAMPQPMMDAATGGILSAGQLADRYTARVPDLLAAIPGETGVDLTEQVMQSLQTLFAVRSTAEVTEETAPRDLIGAIERALVAGRVAEADAFAALLPAEVTAVDPAFFDALSAHAATRAYLSDARRAGLGQTNVSEVAQ